MHSEDPDISFAAEQYLDFITSYKANALRLSNDVVLVKELIKRIISGDSKGSMFTGIYVCTITPILIYIVGGAFKSMYDINNSVVFETVVESGVIEHLVKESKIKCINVWHVVSLMNRRWQRKMQTRNAI